MAQGQLWTTLISAIDPINAKTMPAVLQSTIDLLESELANARAALQELQLQPQPHLSSPQRAAAVAVAAATATTPPAAHSDGEEENHEHPSPAAAGPVVACKSSPLISRSMPRRGPDVNTTTTISTGATPVLLRPLQLTASPSSTSRRNPSLEMAIRQRNPLLRMLSNSLVLDNLAPYLSISALLSLASTNTDFRSVIMDTPYVFRHVDLRRCRGAHIASDEPIDSGGQIWRQERMDESLTEDDFYSGPLRGVFSDFQRKGILEDVRTLILDGLAVPADLITEILTEDRFKITLLSIRECRHLNERKLMQTLQYIVRPSRPKNTPRVKGIYYFGTKDTPSKGLIEGRPSGRSHDTDSLLKDSHTYKQKSCHQGFPGRQWYEPTGRVLSTSWSNKWAETLQLCEGIISFDAVLCRSPRHDPDLYAPDSPNVPPDPFVLPALASIAVGSQGCAACGSAPEGPAVWDQSPSQLFPLLSPPPTHSSRTDTAKCPSLYPGEQPNLILRCDSCIGNRRCSRCQRWWCSTCAPYSVPPNHHNRAVQPRGPTEGNGQALRNFGISRDCWDCGPTCRDCKEEVLRTCSSCQGEYCVEHNEGCTASKCDWCCNTRRTRDLY